MYLITLCIYIYIYIYIYIILSLLDSINIIGMDESNAMENVLQVPAQQDVIDFAMGWLLKLREVHHITESALGDVLGLCKSLHSHFLTYMVQSIPTISDSNASQECLEKFCDYISDHCTWIDAFDVLKSPYQRHLYIQQHYPYVVS